MSDTSSLEAQRRKEERRQRLRAKTAAQFDPTPSIASSGASPPPKSPSLKPPLLREQGGRSRVDLKPSISSVSDGGEAVGGMHEGELYSGVKKLTGTSEVVPPGVGKMVQVLKEDICGGKVNMKFDGVPHEGMCTRAAGMCSIATHETNKCTNVFPRDVESGWFIQPDGRHAVFPRFTLFSATREQEERLVNAGPDHIAFLVALIDGMQEDEVKQEAVERVPVELKHESLEEALAVTEEELLDDGVDESTARAIGDIFFLLETQRKLIAELKDMKEKDDLSMEDIREKFVESNKLVNELNDALGDLPWLKSTYGDVTAAIYNIDTANKEMAEDLKNFKSALTMTDQDVEDLIVDANKEIAAQFQALSAQFVANQGNSPHPVSSGDPLAAILDGSGRIHANLKIAPVDGEEISFEDLVRLVRSQQDRLLKLEAAVHAKGGRSVGTFYFKSLPDVIAKAQVENPNGQGLAAFPDPLTLFDHTVELSAKEEVQMITINKDLEPLDTFILKHVKNTYATCFPYTGDSTSPYEPGKKLPVFKSREIFYGVDAAAGQGTKQQIENLTSKAEGNVTAVASQYLPNAPTFNALATELASRSVKFHKNFLTHCDAEKTVLESLKLAYDDILLLFSEFAQLIFEYLHAEYVPIHKASAKAVDPVTRFSTYLWAILAVHERVEEFIGSPKGFAHHSILQSAFVRFLTRKTGENSSASLGAKLKVLEKEVKEAKSGAADAKRDAVAAKNQAKSASDTAGAALKKANEK